MEPRRNAEDYHFQYGSGACGAPDAPKYSAEMAERMIEAMRQNDIEAVESARSDQTGEILSVINSKYEERLRLYREGRRQWDTSVSITMIIRGIKENVPCISGWGCEYAGDDIDNRKSAGHKS